MRSCNEDNENATVCPYQGQDKRMRASDKRSVLLTESMLCTAARRSSCYSCGAAGRAVWSVCLSCDRKNRVMRGVR